MLQQKVCISEKQERSTGIYLESDTSFSRKLKSLFSKHGENSLQFHPSLLVIAPSPDKINDRTIMTEEADNQDIFLCVLTGLVSFSF